MAFNYDLEKNRGYVEEGSTPPLQKRHGSWQEPDGAVPGETFTYGDSWYARAMRFAGSFGVEQRGIERVPEDERTDKGFRALLNVATMVCFFFVFLRLLSFLGLFFIYFARRQ